MSKMFNYEADQIHDMVHPDLLTDTTHYVAECKDIILTEATPNYPKLTDYESEWLYFYENIYEAGTPVDLEYQEVIVNPYASVANAIPFRYKSAILKGNTFLNVIDNPCILDDYTEGRSQEFILKSSIKSNTEYLIIYDIETNAKKVYTGFLKDSSTWANNTETSITKGFLKLNSGANPNYYRFIVQNGNTLTVNSIMIIEYQEGMENWDIPYFTGMSSVKMPVLKTTGKNLLEYIEWEIDKRLLSDGNLGAATGNSTSNYINVSNLGVITFSGFTKGSHCLYDINKHIIGERVLSSDMTIDVGGAKYIRVTIASAKDHSNPQMEVGSVATSYEPYKSNILTVNEEVTLRSNGDVYDELNLLTGRLTQRIDENNEVLSQEVVKTVDLNGGSIKPYEGTNHYYTSSDTIPPSCTLSIPVESTGSQTLNDINKED